MGVGPECRGRCARWHTPFPWPLVRTTPAWCGSRVNSPAGRGGGAGRTFRRLLPLCEPRGRSRLRGAGVGRVGLLGGRGPLRPSHAAGRELPHGRRQPLLHVRAAHDGRGRLLGAERRRAGGPPRRALPVTVRWQGLRVRAQGFRGSGVLGHEPVRRHGVPPWWLHLGKRWRQPRVRSPGHWGGRLLGPQQLRPGKPPLPGPTRR